jgi:hypothetical protein
MKKSYEEEVKIWDERSRRVSARFLEDFLPMMNPNVPHISADTAKWLRFKGLRWVLQHDVHRKLRNFFWEKPCGNALRYIRSLCGGKPFTKEGDFFFYGIKNFDEMLSILKREDSVLLVGFSYCQKSKSCPSKRFSDRCRVDEENEICQQCFIGKMNHFLPKERTISVCVPTINAIGEEVVAAKKRFPGKNIVFLISSCEMALEMFGDLGNMVGIQGVGVKLQGRICNTMKAFALSEQGIKPGMTWVSNDSEKTMMDLALSWRTMVDSDTVRDAR